MKHTVLNIIGAVAVVTAACVANKYKKETTMDAGIKIENMELSVRPGEDFYDYATRGWRNANPIPDDYVRWLTFDFLRDKTLEQVHDIIKSDTGRIGTLYNVAMDEKRLNTDGIKPLAPYFAEIDALKSAADLPQYLGRTMSITSMFFGDGVALDETDSEHFLYNITQGGIGLARDFFFDTDEKSINIRKKYREYIARTLAHFGISGDADKIYALEERMAKSYHTKEVLRNPTANYHKMTIAEIRDQFTGFDWDAFLTARGATAATKINMAQPSAITESIAIMNDTDFELIRAYLKYNIAAAASSYMDDASYDIAFDFYNRTLMGQKVPKPRWKRVVGILDSTMGEDIGREYVKKYFPADAKKRMQELVHNLQRALGMRIEKLEWMSDETRAAALEKLNGFHAKIGYPDKWRDYSGLHIDANDSLWDNIVRASKFHDRFWIEKIGKPNDPTLWYMNAHEINAYYDPSTNEVCFPAGILQWPFFDMNADDAFNYGAAGSLIGHEMTHGYDDMGRLFDVHGNMRDWWTDADATQFNARADVLRKFFDGIKITPEINANGTFTLGENLADYGGVTIAYTAYKNFGIPSDTVADMTPDMRFFIAYAMTHAGNIRDDAMIKQTKTDEHSLDRNRVNGIMPHIDAWYDAFGITPDDSMYLAPSERVKIW